MPGVADAERRTRSHQSKKDRDRDKEELFLLVKENRLHEADERQLEAIKLALELNQILGERSQQPTLDTEALASAIKGAMSDLISSIPKTSGDGNISGEETTTQSVRPKMRHVDLTTIDHGKSGIDISHGETLTQDTEGNDDSSDKLRRLKELRGKK